MENEKPLLEHMTDTIADAAHATNEAAKSVAKKAKKSSQENDAEEDQEIRSRQ
jgi:hypothetical protein